MKLIVELLTINLINRLFNLKERNIRVENSMDSKYLIKVADYMPKKLERPRKKLQIPLIVIEVELWDDLNVK